ncbi:MJ0042 family finger-like domain-containing protein [Amphritea atlantica]|uniref:MJ0042 family finger-like domain-containing protein n=1 Tax=Amphritea atlantica TaxID=355243 RepID=A0A1H9JH89_9GAMM|nr:DUF3426 domain-containing protein [Amphritea atlantica]SEQ86180.1 MJ0042 family finger-like domain-containing protein [Amphritea atlantica]
MGRNIITECPACHTRFQVTQGQLNIASGKVRCGACLEVFNAEVYRCDDLDDPLESMIRPPEAPAISDQSHKDPLFDSIEIPPFSPPASPHEGIDKRYAPADHLPESVIEPPADAPQVQQLPEQLPGLATRQQSERLQSEADTGLPLTEEDLLYQADPLLAEPQTTEEISETDTAPPAEAPQEQPPLPAAEPADLDQPVSELLHPVGQAQNPQQFDLIDTDRLQSSETGSGNNESPAAAPEATPEIAPDIAPETEPDIAPETEPATVLEAKPGYTLSPDSEDTPRTDSPQSDNNPAPEPPATEQETSSPAKEPQQPAVTSFRAEPVMIRTTIEEPSSRPLGWAILSLLAIMLLAGQYLWFNRQQLNSDPRLHPVYALACEYIPCQLNAPIMLDQISTRKLIIVEHPDYQGVLSVNLLLENHAGFAQPYPAILLAFSDRLGKLISERLFQPSDYLQPDNLDEMPAQQTVEIHFDILDPGRRALSYEASLKAPTPPEKQK